MNIHCQSEFFGTASRIAVKMNNVQVLAVGLKFVRGETSGIILLAARGAAATKFHDVCGPVDCMQQLKHLLLKCRRNDRSNTVGIHGSY